MGLAFLITTENLQLLSERKVLKQAEYAALLDAAQVVEAARGEARRLTLKAERDSAEARQKGHQAGLEQAKVEHARSMLGAALDQHRQLQGLRESMAQLVTQAVTQFIASADPAALFEAALLRVDALVRSEPFVNVRVSPGDAHVLEEVLARLRAEAGWAMPISMQSDPALPAGACVLQTSAGTLDIGLDAQLTALRRALEVGAAH